MISKAWTNLYSSREIIWSLPFPVYRSFGCPDKTQQQEQSWRAYMVVTIPLRPFCHEWWSDRSNLPSCFWNWPLQKQSEICLQGQRAHVLWDGTTPLCLLCSTINMCRFKALPCVSSHWAPHPWGIFAIGNLAWEKNMFSQRQRQALMFICWKKVWLRQVG